MAVKALRIDGDDLAFDLLPDIERSFGIVLPRDLRHISTVSDLYQLIAAHAPGVSGAACGTVVAFHLLRRALAGHGVDARARPDLILADQGLPAPERLRKQLGAVTGLELPARVVGGWCLVALGLFVLLPVVAWLTGQAWLALTMPLICWLVGRLDKGSWSSDWATLGSLARATAALNHAALVRQGARHSPQSVWNTLRNLLAAYGIGTRDIGPDTWLMAPPPGRA